MENRKYISSLQLILFIIPIAICLSSLNKNQACLIASQKLSPQSKFNSKITFNQAKDTLKGVVPYKGYELRIEIPDGFVCSSSDIADIKQNLAGRNWFWKQADEATQGRAVERIRILLDKLSTIQESDTFRELVGGRRVVAIYTAGSYPWHDKPGDIDIHFIVEGEMPWKKRELTPEKAEAVGITVAGSGKAMGKIALQVFGIADLKKASQDEDLGDDGDLQRKLLTIYGNAVYLGGVDLFKKNSPPSGDFRILAFHLKELASRSEGLARKEKRLLEAKAIELAFGFSPFDVWDAIHVNELLRKFRRNKALEGQGRAPLLKIGDNFLPSVLLTESQRTALLGAVDYDEIVGDASNAESAKNTSVTLNCLDGGLGLATKRERYLEETAKRAERDPRNGKVQLGAKGTDLFFEVNGELVSIAEIKLLHAIVHASDFREAIFQPLVNGDSAKSYEALLERPYFLDKIDKTRIRKRTYRQVMKEKGLRLIPGKGNEMLLQSDLPVIDLENGKLTEKYTAPGGHGQWGVRLLYEALGFCQEPNDGRVHIRAFYNGDNIASFADRNIVGWMARNRIPIVMVSTTKAGLDRKGGQIGIQRLDGGTLRVQMLEIAQAKKVDKSTGKREHERLFYAIGLPGLAEVEGRDILGTDLAKSRTYTNKTGEQFFNTNVAFINYSVLAPILKELTDLKGVEFEGEILSGEALIERVISPDLIENVKKKDDNKNYTQLEGAIGSCFLNLATFFDTSKDERVQGILRKHLGERDRLLRIVNVKPDKRTKLFTPVKTSFDYWFQAYSDYYSLDTEDWTLDDEGGEGTVPPEVEFSGPEAENYYTDVQNCIDAFGNASTRGLTYLHIKGKVLLKDAILRGRVEILSDSPAMVDLNNPEMRKEFGLSEKGQLVLDNVTIRIPEGAQQKRLPHGGLRGGA